MGKITYEHERSKLSYLNSSKNVCPNLYRMKEKVFLSTNKSFYCSKQRGQVDNGYVCGTCKGDAKAPFDIPGYSCNYTCCSLWDGRQYSLS